MYPLGHFSLGYIISKIVSVFTKEDVNLTLVFIISVLPDIDVVIPFVFHRGPTHSIITASLFFIPFFIKYRRGLPYFSALLSHSLIGDFFTAYGCKLLWPLSNSFYKANIGYITYSMEFPIELSLFIVMIIHILYIQRKKIHDLLIIS